MRPSVIPGFVHRDLKPENVLIGADKLSDANINRLRVTDFGLAVVLESEYMEQEVGSGEQGAERSTRHALCDPLSRTQLTRRHRPARRRTWPPSSGVASRSARRPTCTR